MVFNSAAFLFLFLPAAVLLHRLVPGRTGKALLLGALSVVFYAFGGLAQVPVLLLAFAWNYVFGLLLAREGGPRRLAAALAVTGDLALLGVYKYLGFLLHTVGLSSPWSPTALPMGISFFTFHAVSYIVDVYRDRSLAQKRPDALFLYIAFFPRLIAGPILPWRQAAAEPFGHDVSAEDTAAALRRFVRGLAKKLLIAESAAAAANGVFALPAAQVGTALAWLGAVSYSLQIYFDFSGYSDMAIALGKLFGFDFPENFDHPYAARTLTAFWRRWHMTLNRWFVDYLYIPLGGSRRGAAVTLRNTMIVFFFTGLWHGAGWTFILWGLWHGALVCLERLNTGLVGALEKSAPGRAALHLYTLLAVVTGFVMFRADSVAQGLALLGRMFVYRGADLAGAVALRRILTPGRGVMLLLGAVFSLPLRPRLSARLEARLGGPVSVEAAADALALAGLAVCVLALAGGGFTPFIYQQF
ncbi:MAG: MBOAT family protein [Oscillospiraceae bacterium]|nr:MBOAT family protein [Oscillospiraceae bacterium]